MIENIQKIKIKLENIWIDLIRSIYALYTKLWPYVSGTIPKPRNEDTDKLARWEELDVQVLSTILMNVTPNVQAGLDCPSAKTTWDGLLN